MEKQNSCQGNLSMQTTEAAAVKKSGITTRELVIDAMLIALTYIFTAFVNLRLPIAANGGLIHLGNVPLFLAAIIFGRRTGTLAGAFGMGLFDLLSGWYLWAPFTFRHRRLHGLHRRRYHRKASRLRLECAGYRCCLCHQGGRLLYRRGLYLWQLDRSGNLYSRQPGSDRRRCYHRDPHCGAA